LARARVVPVVATAPDPIFNLSLGIIERAIGRRIRVF
jgi:hypothetical protein